MKKILKRALAVVGVLLALAVGGVATKFYVLLPKMRPAPDVKAPTTPEAIERGKYLANHVAACVGCHSKVDTSVSGEPPVEGFLGAGRDFGEMPGFPGHLRAPNLTPDKETGLGSWTDGEVLRAIREGVGKDGRVLFPQMPYVTYSHTLSDDDALAVIAYLRSLEPVKNNPGRAEIGFPVSMFIRGVPKPLEKSPPPPPTDKLARGNWLLEICSCSDCHDSMDAHMNKIPGKRLAGGMGMPVGDKGMVYAANLTSDKATGIGSYSDDDIRRAINEGKAKSGRTLYIMPWYYYKGMTDEDKDALIVALRAVPAVANVVPPATIK
jgi:mono/diheme cytochrome c family protein